MRKQKFLLQLEKALKIFPRKEAEERLSFYSEMIDDRIEEGLSEEAAVREIGEIREIIRQIEGESMPLKGKKPEKEKMSKAMKNTLLILGFPLWFPLLISAFVVIVSLYVSLWAVIIALWAAFVLLAAGALCGAAAGVGYAIGGFRLTGVCLIAAGLVCAGIAIFMFFLCIPLTKRTVCAVKKRMSRKRFFFGREAA